MSEPHDHSPKSASGKEPNKAVGPALPDDLTDQEDSAPVELDDLPTDPAIGCDTSQDDVADASQDLAVTWEIDDEESEIELVWDEESDFGPEFEGPAFEEDDGPEPHHPQPRLAPGLKQGPVHPRAPHDHHPGPHKAPAKKAPGKKAAAKKIPGKKAPAKKVPGKKALPKKHAGHPPPPPHEHRAGPEPDFGPGRARISVSGPAPV